jgi:hypothetical protein
MAPDVVEAVFAVRLRHPSWGPEKVKAYLERTAPEMCWPSASSMGRQFALAGLVRPRKCRVRTPGPGHPWRPAWQAMMSDALTSRVGF